MSTLETIARVIPTIGTWLTVQLSCGHIEPGVHFKHGVGDTFECVTCRIARELGLTGEITHARVLEVLRERCIKRPAPGAVDHAAINARRIAHEVIHEACEKHDGDVEAVLQDRYRTTAGGVGHAHRKLLAAVRAEIHLIRTTPYEPIEPDVHWMAS